MRKVNPTRNDLLIALYEEGEKRIEHDFSLERVLI
jgi:hypothetical protein